jgi:hypothetical protein
MEFCLLVILLVLVMIMNLNCMIIGLKIGLALSKGERVELPNPVKAYKEHKASKEVQKEIDRVSIIMQNVESYDGTGFHQEEVPGR